MEFSRPGKPTDNAFAERCNGRFRDECLDQYRFASLEEARQTIEAWRPEDNTERPHRSLGQPTPAAWEAAWATPTEAPDEPFPWTKTGGTLRHHQTQHVVAAVVFFGSQPVQGIARTEVISG